MNSVKSGLLIAEYRKKANLTQKTLAKSLGYSSAQFISNFERGRAAIPGRKFKRLVKILKLNEQESEVLLNSVVSEKIAEIKNHYR